MNYISKPYKKRVDELVNPHWHCIEQLLQAHECLESEIRIAEFHYKEAARHFYKHALEDVDAGYYAEGA